MAGPPIKEAQRALTYDQVQITAVITDDMADYLRRIWRMIIQLNSHPQPDATT